jgi:DNA replication protein DnaC
MPYKIDFSLSVIERIGKSMTPEFTLTPEVRDMYQQLIRYFHGDPEFKGDLLKGILLMGPAGTGKSLAMQIMRKYRQIDDVKFIMDGKTYQMNFDIIDVNQLVSYFMENAFDGIEAYCRRYVICLDDIGTEIDQVKHYGNNLDVISHVLAERYSKRLLTFGTTNYPVKILEDKYDDRIVSRMFALFNFIIFKGQDFRKTNNKV